MSRVSEALRKAAAEKQLDSPTSAEKESSETVLGSLGLRGFEAEKNVMRHKAPNTSRRNAQTTEVLHEQSVVVGVDVGEASVVPLSDAYGANGQKSLFGKWLSMVMSGRRKNALEEFPLMALERRSPSESQYKILREQIINTCVERCIRCFAVTSPIKGDGKSTVAANLAASMALESDHQVILIDADLRNPSIDRFFKSTKKLGLADYLNADSDVNVMGYLQETSVKGLRIIPAGRATSLSAELLAKERMKKVLEEIKTQLPHAQIVVDTPPVLSTADPLVLARHVDGIVMVVRAEKTPRDCFAEAVKLIGETKLIGLVLNHARLGMSSKYYYYDSFEA